jgi:hypothetical protein
MDGTTFNNIGSPLTMTTEWQVFLGYRYGVFNFSTKSGGGKVKISSFEQELTES